MGDKRVDCPVILPPELRIGAFANAFRVIEDGAGDLFLDFLVYSEREGAAQVVARIRVHQTFLKDIRDRLALVIREIVDKAASVRPALPPTAPEPTWPELSDDEVN